MIRRPPKSPLFPYTPSPDPADVREEPRRLPTRRGRARTDPLGRATRMLGRQPVEEHGVGNLTGHAARSEEHTSELQSRLHLVCRLLLEKKKYTHLRTS